MQFGVIPICDRRFSDDPRYEYSADGRAPVAPDTMMPDPLEWPSFAAAGADRLIIAAYEAGDSTPEALSALVGGYRDRVVAVL